MGLLKFRYNFSIDFFSKDLIYPFYSEICNKFSGECYSPSVSSFSDYPKNKIHVINHIPPYIDLKVDQNKGAFGFFRTHYLEGFLANLNDFDSVDAYLKSQFGTKSRSKIRAYKRRLETCFTISYKMHHGYIAKEHYDFLFERFLTMIERRFEQRGGTHGDLEIWDIIRDISYNLILNKKASLFVVYDGKKPIDICLNYHHQNIFNNSIRSYDIDYSKFRLGHIDILKQLEWCFENNHMIFDLSYGDLDYKRKWCNTVYEFEQHVLFPKNQLSKKIQAFIIIKLLVFKAFLKKKKVNLLFSKIKSHFRTTNHQNQKNEEVLFTVFDDIELNPNLAKTEIDINTKKYGFLRKYSYDFLYQSFESSKNISVYKMEGKESSFLIIGIKKNRLIKPVFAFNS